MLAKLTVRHKASLDSILGVLEHLSRHLPRIKTFTELVIGAKYIEKAVCGLYEELIHFFIEATTFFSRNPVSASTEPQVCKYSKATDLDS